MLIPILIAFSLNFDTFSVAIVEGASDNKHTLQKSVMIALIFGLTQALLTLAGFFLGANLRSYIENIDHWIAFFLLLLIGGKIIIESFQQKNKEKFRTRSANWISIILLSIATSIDALAVGISLAFIKIGISDVVVIVGVASFITAFIGYNTGKKLQTIFKNKIKIIGGIILILIGIKILAEHLFF